MRKHWLTRAICFLLLLSFITTCTLAAPMRALANEQGPSCPDDDDDCGDDDDDCGDDDDDDCGDDDDDAAGDDDDDAAGDDDDDAAGDDDDDDDATLSSDDDDDDDHSGDRSDLDPPRLYDDGNRNRRILTMVFGTIVGAALGWAIGGGALGLAIGGMAAYLFSNLAARDLFPNEYEASKGQWTDHRRFQWPIPRPSQTGMPDQYNDGYYGGQAGNASLEELHDRYYETLEVYEEAVESGDRAAIGNSRQEYMRARSAYLRARGLWVGPPIYGK